MMMTRFDERGIRSGDLEVLWDDLTAVGIRTTAEGPLVDDVFWLFLFRGGALEVPGAAVDVAVLNTMHERLPGMDSLKIVSAMGSTSERVFRVWHVEDSRHRWDDLTFSGRFLALVERLGGDRLRADEAFRRLRKAWSAPERRYHDLEHLAECLGGLDRVRADSKVNDIAELALWYHDVVHGPRIRDTEKESAAMLRKDGSSMGLQQEVTLEAASCVLATAHLSRPLQRGPAVDLVVDADLSILGRDFLRFMEFEYAVEEEYARTPSPMYFLARGRFLANLLASPAIFRTPHFRETYESTARANISVLLRSRRYRLHRWLVRAHRWATSRR